MLAAARLLRCSACEEAKPPGAKPVSASREVDSPEESSVVTWLTGITPCLKREKCTCGYVSMEPRNSQLDTTGCTHTHLSHEQCSAHSALTAYFAHLHACHTHAWLKCHEKGVCRMSVFVLCLVFSLLMIHLSLLFLHGHFESTPDYDFTDVPIHMILPYFPVLKAQDTRNSAPASRSLATWPSQMQTHRAAGQQFGNCDGSRVLEVLQERWISVFRRMHTLRTDPEGAWRNKEVHERLSDMQIVLDLHPGEASWQASVTENTKIVKDTMTRIALERPDLKSTEVLAAAVRWSGFEVFLRLSGHLDVHRTGINHSSTVATNLRIRDFWIMPETRGLKHASKND